MNREADRARRLAIPLPVSGWPLVALIATFALAGTIGHDPWKIEDAAHFGVVWRAIDSGDWLALRFATGSLVEPPLYYWASAATGALLSPLIGWPDAVRLASPVFALIAGAALFAAARAYYGVQGAAAAPLLLAGCLGFMVQSHETQPMLATVAGVAVFLAGTASAASHAVRSSILVAAGIAVVILAHGLAFLPALGITTAVSIAAAENRARCARTVLAGIGIGAALGGIWWIPLSAGAPAALAGWWMSEVAQFTPSARVLGNLPRIFELLAWFTWPALPLALWAVWAQRANRWTAGILVPSACTIAILLTLALVVESRVVAALALLPPLALLGVPGVIALRRGAANALDWFGRMTFSLIAFLIWLGWVAMQFGFPPRVARNFAKLAPGFEASLDPFGAAIAVIATALWIGLLIRHQPGQVHPLRPVAHWTAGVALIWILVTSLWLPWIDHGKTYRSIGNSIARQIAPKSGCIAARNLGEGQFASLDYFVEHRLVADRGSRGNAARRCNWLLIQGAHGEVIAIEGWRKIWEGSRPGDRSERFRLYRRERIAEDAPRPAHAPHPEPKAP